MIFDIAVAWFSITGVFVIMAFAADFVLPALFPADFGDADDGS